MKKILGLGLIAVLMSPMVSAHTISVGVTSGGAPGSVSLWLGTYHTSAPIEGFMQLIAGPSGPLYGAGQ